MTQLRRPPGRRQAWTSKPTLLSRSARADRVDGGPAAFGGPRSTAPYGYGPGSLPSGGHPYRARISLGRTVTLHAVRSDITALRWIAGVNVEITLATLAAVHAQTHLCARGEAALLLAPVVSLEGRRPPNRPR